MSAITFTIANQVDTYLRAWCESEPAQRRKLLQECFAAKGSYQDSLVKTSSRKSLGHLMSHIHNLCPGLRIVLDGPLQEHESCFLFRWHMLNEHGGVQLAGTDYGEWNGKGFISRIARFFPSEGMEAYEAFTEGAIID